MADQKQTPEFLGGSPKFNSVGRDNRETSGLEEPITPINQTGHWLRIGGGVLLVVLLAGALFYLNESNLGRTTLQPMRGGHAIVPSTPKAPSDPNLK